MSNFVGFNLVDLEKFSKFVLERELAVLASNDVVERLRSACSTKIGLQYFAEQFYPIRYSFVQLAFTVGARAPMHEDYWYGLSKNLFEEAGENSKLSHNQLYRRFLTSIGLDGDMAIPTSDVSMQFNEAWFNFVSTESIEKAIAAIAIYEIIDSPDYSALYNALNGVHADADLKFFEVHSVAEHFSMFDKFFFRYTKEAGGKIDDFLPVVDFVIENQNKMWSGLLQSMESQIHQAGDFAA